MRYNQELTEERKKNYMIISNRFRKGIWKIRSWLIIKNFQQTRNRRKCSQSGKGSPQNSWKGNLNTFWNRTRTPTLTTSLLYCIEGHSAIKQEKEIKDLILERKKWNCLRCICRWHVYVWLKKKKQPLGRCKITTRMNTFSAYKVNMQKSNIFL